MTDSPRYDNAGNVATTMLTCQLAAAEERAAVWERIAAANEAECERLRGELAVCHTEAEECLY